VVYIPKARDHRYAGEIMRIVLVTQSYYPRPGGVSEHVHHSASELRRRGHEVTIVTSRCGDEPPEPGVVRIGRNVLVPFNGAWVNVTLGARLTTDLGRAFDAARPEIIHLHCPLAPTLPLLTLLHAPKDTRIIGTFHEAAERNLIYWGFKGMLARAARRLDTRIAVSRAALSLARKYVGGEYVIVPNGVDCSRFSPEREPIGSLRDDAFNVLYVGRLDKRKGVKYLFRAVALAAKTTNRRIRLIVVGNDGFRRRFLPRLPRRVDVHFAGVVGRDLLPRYFATGDVFCAPAVDRESFGIVLLEAMATGVPVIGSAIPGYLTVLSDRWNSLVVPPKDESAIARAIVELIDDPELRTKIRGNGFRTIERYRWERIVAHLEGIYANRGTADASYSPRESTLSSSVQIQKA
jgi:phosphatidylinositol alpha-mannosyltransferase